MIALKYWALAGLFGFGAGLCTGAAFGFGPWMGVLAAPVWAATGWCVKRASFG